MPPVTHTPPVPKHADPRRTVTSITEADDLLARWATSVVRTMAVTFGPLPGETAELTANFLLADLEPIRVGRMLRGDPPLRALATYLVSVWSSDAKDAHRVTGDLLFAAMQQPALFTVSSGSPLWHALRLPPHPCFALLLPIERSVEPAKAASPVESVRLKAGPARVLNGALRGPRKAPIADALVEIPALNLQTRTDARGLFTLGAVTAGLGTLLIRLTAKGAQREVRARLPRFPAPLIIDLEDL